MKLNAVVLSLAVLSMTFSCGKKESDPNKIFAGESSKKWKADKETNASGDKEKLDSQEKKEVMEFYNNGQFSINGSGQGEKGTWNYDNTSKNLSLQFGNATVSENFSVVELKDDEIKLKAADGSTMVLDAE